MRVKVVVISLLLVALSVPGWADEVLVFKDNSPYRGKAIRVVSHETRGDRLILTTSDGNIFSVPADIVDWERSKDLTERSANEAAREAEQKAAEDEARKEREARAAAAEERRKMGVLEASQRYGVANPAVSVTVGTAFQERAPASESGGEPAGAAPSGGGDQDALKQNVDAARAELDRIQQDVNDLRNDTNPDPVWAAQRQARLQQKEQELSTAEQRVRQAEDQLTRAQAQAAAQQPGQAQQPGGGS